MSTGTFPSSTTYPGFPIYPDPGTPAAGTGVLLRAFIDISGSPTGAPSWSALSDTRVRAFNTSRGRESELSEFDAGTATLLVDNRDRAFDPTFVTSPYYPYIRPMTRFWLQVEIGGTLYDLFKGYAESFDGSWPNGGWSDAECAVSLVDEFKVLSLAALPTTNPPRDNYEDVVMFDDPAVYYRMGDESSTYAQTAKLGSDLRNPTAVSASGSPGAIVGDSDGYARIVSSGPSYLQTGAIDEMGGDFTDVGGMSEMAVETWFTTDTVLPAGGDYLIAGPQAGGAGLYQYELSISSAGQINVTVRDNLGNTRTVTSGAILANHWYHIVGQVRSGIVRLYLNGAEVGSSVLFPGAFVAPDAGAVFRVGDAAGAMANADYDEVAVYRHSLTDARILAHYQAGALRGFANQAAGTRISAALDAAGSTAARAIGAGARTILRRRQTGQAPLDVIREATQGEAVDAALFVSKSGVVTFLDSAHRSSSPYNTVQATFDDDGTDTAYLDVGVDYSETFLSNEWNITRENGPTQTASDSTSISKFFRRSQSQTLPVTSDADCTTIAAAMLAKYKDPLTRVTQLSFNTVDATIAAVVFARDLCDRIRVLRTPPGGGARLDQTAFIQKIAISGDNSGGPWTITWGVSPL